MKIYLDTEFHEYPKTPRVMGIKAGRPINTIDLISIGLAAEDGSEYYAVSSDFDVKAAWDDPWLRENVLWPIYAEFTTFGDAPFSLPAMREVVRAYGKGRERIAKEVVTFAGKSPEFWAYFADYDWVVFCWIFGRMIDLPEGFPYLCLDLKQLMLSKGLTQEWKEMVCPTPANAHNALADARWNREFHKYLE